MLKLGSDTAKTNPKKAQLFAESVERTFGIESHLFRKSHFDRINKFVKAYSYHFTPLDTLHDNVTDTDDDSDLRRISCHGRNHSQASCEYSLTIFLCCQHHSEYSLFGSKFSTNLLFAASKCHVTIQQRCSSRCSKWSNRMGSLQW